MSAVYDDINELKIIVRCTIVASIEPLTINELWKKVGHVVGGPDRVQLELFGYDKVFDFLKDIPDVVQLEEPENENSVVNLVSSDLSRHMEILVSSNVQRPPKNKHHLKELLVPYQTQCAFIRIFSELYPKGLSIDDFVSDVLSIPIFKSYIDCAEELLFNLDHIIKKNGFEMISLQPRILNSLKKIKEEGKFNSREIKNIDELSLQSSNEDKPISFGLEYPLFYILEQPIKDNIQLLLNEKPIWIAERNINDLYTNKFGSTFVHYRRWGFKRVSQMFSKLPELCCVHFSENEVQIITVKYHTCDKKTNLVEEICDSKLSIRDTSEEKPNEFDGVLKKFLINDSFLKISLNDCFLDQEIQNIELKVNQSLDVKVCRVNMSILPTVVCQCLNKSDELKNLLTDMKRFYFLNEEKLMFNPSLTMVNQIYAFYLDDLWYRGIVTDVDLTNAKIMDIDTGYLNILPFDDIRILHKRFSQFPAQAFTCHLHKVKTIHEDELSQIVNKKCTIFVAAIDKINKTTSVKIKLINSSSNQYLNDEWIANCVAEPDE